MAHTAQAQTSPTSAPNRPKGILKNSNSYQQTSPEAIASVSPGVVANNDAPPDINGSGSAGGHMGMPPRGMSDKEITQINTEINAGGAHRRNSSNPRGGISRRQSGQMINGQPGEGEPDEGGMRLKWDEANLYNNEGQMGGRMKITEPKTPFASGYNPAEDEGEVENIDAKAIAVDELDMGKQQKPAARNNDVPGLDLGEPEMDPIERQESDGERRVVVDSDHSDVGDGHHGEEDERNMTPVQREAHKDFKLHRKEHYAAENARALLAGSVNKQVPEQPEEGEDSEDSEDSED